jgi:hypothetical protein
MKTIVLFRVKRGKQYAGEVTAVFPCEPWSSAHDMACCAHVGQHGSCDTGWYRTTRPAKPEEYADLKRELESYGSDPDDHYDLDVRQRMPAYAIERRRAAMRKMNTASATSI